MNEEGSGNRVEQMMASSAVEEATLEMPSQEIIQEIKKQQQSGDYEE